MEISDDPFTCAEQLVFISKSETRLAFDTRGRIFSQTGNELGASSLLTKNEFLNDFLLQFVPSWKRACFQTD